MLDALRVSTNEQATIRWIKPFIVLDIWYPPTNSRPVAALLSKPSDPYRLGLFQLGAVP